MRWPTHDPTKDSMKKTLRLLCAATLGINDYADVVGKDGKPAATRSRFLLPEYLATRKPISTETEMEFSSAERGKLPFFLK